jgi:large subunit ribosomal protein L22
MVIDLIRGKDVLRAREILQFNERNVSEVVEKCLNSAVANAARDGAKPEGLFVKTTYADDGPTLKRFRPRAKGSASRIRKRSCHITVIVATREEA